MKSAGRSEVWTGPQLAAQLATVRGAAPPPACHVVLRSTLLPDGTEAAFYEVPGESGPLEPDLWPNWLGRRGLCGAQQLRIPLLVIRESLDAAGLLAECALERRLGAPDGPFHGDPSRVEFVGAARVVRLYRAQRNGQLAPVALSPQALPPAPRGAEPFAGEVQALERRFGPGLRIIDARDPTLFEDAVGLASIMHVELRDGQPLGCGVGWFGTTPFILVADFPRFDMPLALPPRDEAAVTGALHRLGLVRHETRLDETGLAVMARRHGGLELFRLRVAGGDAAAEPYLPDASRDGSADQQGWLRYAAAHEKLTPLDQHADGASSDLIVLTGDANGHVWRHLVDPDGVELWRRPADGAAVAVLHRESLMPGSLARSEEAPGNGDDETLPDRPLPPESLLAKTRAFETAIGALHAARDIVLVAEPDADPSALASQLRTVIAALDALDAERSASHAATLLDDLPACAQHPDRLLRDLSYLHAALLDELAALRLVALPPAQWRRLNDAAPFGAAVEMRFPSCAYDIEEAASCLAFGRPTAAVFHCMKVIERGLQALGRRAGLADFPGGLRGWMAIAAALRPACPPDLQPALTHLQQVRRRWHAPSLEPADKYTEAEADLVFRSVGAFMRELAERCDEAGEPVSSDPY